MNTIDSLKFVPVDQSLIDNGIVPKGTELAYITFGQIGSGVNGAILLEDGTTVSHNERPSPKGTIIENIYKFNWISVTYDSIC